MTEPVGGMDKIERIINGIAWSMALLVIIGLIIVLVTHKG